MMVKVHSKYGYKDKLETSIVYLKSLSKNQEYLYVVGIHKDTNIKIYVLNYNNSINFGGDFYYASDFEIYDLKILRSKKIKRIESNL